MTNETYKKVEEKIKIARKNCRCREINKLAENFVGDIFPIKRNGAFCSLLYLLMKDFDSRFERNTGKDWGGCVCPVCGQELCDWCSVSSDGTIMEQFKD